MQYFGMVDSSRIANLLQLCGICLMEDGTVGNTRNNREICIKYVLNFSMDIYVFIGNLRAFIKV